MLLDSDQSRSLPVSLHAKRNSVRKKRFPMHNYFDYKQVFLFFCEQGAEVVLIAPVTQLRY